MFARALGTGGIATGLLIVGPMSAFAPAGAAVVAFWWNDWPASRLRTPWTLARTCPRRSRRRWRWRGPPSPPCSSFSWSASADRWAGSGRSGQASPPSPHPEQGWAPYDDQLRRGLFGEILDLNDRYQLDAEIRRRGRDSPNQVLHTHGYREYFQVAAEYGKNVADLTGAEHAEVGEQVVQHVRDYTCRQRTWFSKLPAVHMVDSPSQAYRLLSGALPSGA